MFLTYREIVKENPELARRKLIEIYKMTGNVSETARRCGASRKTVRKIVRRYEEFGEKGLEDLKRAPKRVHNRTPKEIEEKVVELRKRTGYGPKRLSRILGMSPYTIRNILRRYGLTRPYQVKAAHKGKRVTVYTAEHYAPLQFFQVDLKEILDKKTLPWEVYMHIKRYNFPLYQWTAIDVRTRLRFIAYSYEKSFAFGLLFMRLVVLWLRGFGIRDPVYIQTDWGEEFGGKSHRKLIKMQGEYFDSLGARVYRTRKGRKEDNGFVERSHRTDDEEFYIPKVMGVYDSDGFLEIGRRWLWYYNVERGHWGKGMEGKTPFEKAKGLIPWLHPAIAYFPVPLLDNWVDSKFVSQGGTYVQAHYKFTSQIKSMIIFVSKYY